MRAADRDRIVKILNVADLTSEYVKYGCVRIPKLLDDDTVRLLAQESQKLLVGESEQLSLAINFFERKEWQTLLWTTPQNVTILYDILGQSPQLDAALESILAHPIIDRLLLDVLGTDYKMWLLQIRRANPGSDCLRIHQDRPGETCLQILLDDIPSPAGSTVLLPGSDVWPRIINSMPFIDPKYLAPWLRSLTGKKGDAWLFTRTVWHGRLQADSRRSQTVLMLSFLPCCANQNIVLPPPNILEQLGPKLQAAFHNKIDLSDSHLAATPELQKLLVANPRFKWWSPWQLAIGLSYFFSLALSVWRFCKRR
ncbi:putative 2OG-Fe(II) oxygenase [Chamaesiphon minutus]|uniref:Protein involved in biosynthesis of mitomycin antibiotics/polyketide fumonisin n=1 Tax=Chamaesiphon minutus (strain ATCC 27169 / PCC 6605) TaxID=1173020 RepID=K9UFD0_CHAP6|nr:putative 2OG-Fe(II) oxygenase [Chamaesiphon minutus]AFY93348.1 protein involved in biosynthesis of mitomycin antibiotics/polyketide fumonisin [Chamaesiphon minutus PCC 6605]